MQESGRQRPASGRSGASRRARSLGGRCTRNRQPLQDSLRPARRRGSWDRLIPALSLEARVPATRRPPQHNGVSLLKTRAMVGRHRSAASERLVRNHMTDIATVDMFVAATVTSKRLDAVTGLIISHHQRRIIHFEVTRNSTQIWLARQSTEPFLSTAHPAISARPTATRCFQIVARLQQQAHSDRFSPLRQPSCMDSNGLSSIRQHFSLGSLVLCYLKQLRHQTRKAVGAIAPPGHS